MTRENGVRARGGALRAAFLLPVVLCAAGCAAPGRTLRGDAARDAGTFFSASTSVPYPFKASWSGVAAAGRRSVPFILGVNASSADAETMGVYDPLGREVLLVAHAGGAATVTRGPAAGEIGDGELAPLIPPEKTVRIDAFSLSRLLAGGAAYPVGEGRAALFRDGAWGWEDGRQEVRTDPGRRFVARAEYDVSGIRITVTYPGRESPGTPRVVAIETRGARIVLRRDAE